MFVYAQAHTEEYAAKAACGPRAGRGERRPLPGWSQRIREKAALEFAPGKWYDRNRRTGKYCSAGGNEHEKNRKYQSNHWREGDQKIALPEKLEDL